MNVDEKQIARITWALIIIAALAVVAATAAVSF
jgi:hypothetical protein